MRLRLLVWIAFAAVLLGPSATQARTKIADPVQFVAMLYAKMAAATVEKPYVAPEDVYTPRLAALFALAKREAHGEVGRIDFDFWSNAQDWQLSEVNVTSVPVEGAANRRVVIAKFRNFQTPNEIHFYFVKTGKDWLLDDARSMTGETWTLSLILKYGWDGKP